MTEMPSVGLSGACRHWGAAVVAAAAAVAVAAAAALPAGAGVAQAAPATTPSGTTGPLKALKRLTVKVSPHHALSPPYRFTISGLLVLPPGVTHSQGCKGTITVVVKLGSKQVDHGSGKVSKRCTYTGTGSFTAAQLSGHGAVSFTVKFSGNRKLARLIAKPVTALFG